MSASKPKDAGGMVVGERVEVKCCACDGTVIFAVPQTDEDNPTFFHTIPYCKRFEETNTAEQLIEYVRACRQGN